MKCEWRLTDPPVEFGSAIASTLIELVNEQLPELLEMFPMQFGWSLKSHFDQDWFTVRVTDRRGSAIPRVDKFNDLEVQGIREKLVPFVPRSHPDLIEALGAEWFDFHNFTYAGPYSQGMACWPDVHQHLVDWLNGFVLPTIEARNRQRVLRAIPEAPQFNIELIRQHLWILECDDSIRQGTAFALEGVGLVTCEHVLGPGSRAFRAWDIHKKFPIRVLSSNADLDLAVLALDPPISSGLQLGTADGLREMEHVAVVGFPNYHLGDSGVISPGLVIGFRIRSGIRRILTNAPIVAGASGGPVLDKNNRVVGVAVTGSDSFGQASDTEKHGVIPIDALRLLASA